MHFAFPAGQAQGLEWASDAELAQVEVLGLGLGLHWERLDVDLSVPGLFAGLFGTKAYVDRQRAARAGSATSADKAAAARRNARRAAGRARRQSGMTTQKKPTRLACIVNALLAVAILPNWLQSINAPLAGGLVPVVRNRVRRFFSITRRANESRDARVQAGGRVLCRRR